MGRGQTLLSDAGDLPQVRFAVIGLVCVEMPGVRVCAVSRPWSDPDAW